MFFRDKQRYIDVVSLHKRTQLKQTILSETTAIGLRFRTEARLTLEREGVTVETPWGEVVAKKVHYLFQFSTSNTISN